jgi:hypothetical protein
MREMNRLLRTAYSKEEQGNDVQGNDVQGTPYFTGNTPDKISPWLVQCSNVLGIAFPPTVRKYPQACPYSARAGLFSAIFSQGAEMELLKIFFTFWSVTIIALLTLLGIDVIRIWMLDRQPSKM